MIKNVLTMSALCAAFFLCGMELEKHFEYYSDEQISAHTQLQHIAEKANEGALASILQKLTTEKEVAAVIAAAEHKGPIFIPQSDGTLSSRFAEPIVHALNGDIAWWRMHDTPGTPQQLQLASLSDPTKKIVEVSCVINNYPSSDTALLCMSDSGSYFLVRNKGVHTIASVSSIDERYNFFGFSWTSCAFIGDELLLCHDGKSVEMIGIPNGSIHHTIAEPTIMGDAFAVDTPQCPSLIGISENLVAVKLCNKKTGIERYELYAGAGELWKSIGAVLSKKSFDTAHVVADEGDLCVLEHDTGDATLSRWIIREGAIVPSVVSIIPDVQAILSCDLYKGTVLITRISKSRNQSVIDVVGAWGGKIVSFGLPTMYKAFWSRAEKSVISLISTCGGVPRPCSFAIEMVPSRIDISSGLMKSLEERYQQLRKKSDN